MESSRNIFAHEQQMEDKVSIIKLITDISIRVENGESDPLTAFAMLKRLEATVKDGIARVDESARIEATKHIDSKSKSFEHQGVNFTFRLGGKVWDFKGIKEWIKVDEEKTRVQDKLKAAYEANQKSLLVADGDGVEIELPKVSYKKDSLSVKL